MNLRHCLACVALALYVCGSYSPAATPATPRPENPTAQAAKAVADAEVVLKKAQADLQKARDKVKNQLKVKPEWSGVTADATKAEADLKTAQRNAMSAVHAKPEFLELVKQREEAEKVQLAFRRGNVPGSDDPKISDADAAAANDAFIKASIQMKAMEKQALADDQMYNDAKGRLEGSNAKLAQLDAEVDETVKADPEYMTLVQAVATAQQQVDTAKQSFIAAKQSAQASRQTSAPKQPRSK